MIVDLSNIKYIYLGTNKIDKLYIGDVLLWSSES